MAHTKRGVLYSLDPKGQETGDVIKLRRDSTIFGREKGDVVLGDAEISSSHCQIQNVDGSYYLFDMNSTNGTFINGQRSVKALLKDGDVIKFGRSVFRFMLEDTQRLRHINTIFKTSNESNDGRVSLVDTLIDRELSVSGPVGVLLQVTYSDNSQERIEVKQRVFFIGRASSFGKFDQDTEISRKHVLIKLNDANEIFVEDQGSTNGTFLNDRQIKGMHRVKAKDQLKIGGCLLTLTPIEY